MRPIARWSAPSLCIAAWFVAAWLFSPASSPAAEVTMKSGYRLEGALGKIAGLGDSPLKPAGAGGEIDNRLIVLVDDGLRRTFACTYQVREAREAEPLAMTRIKVKQRIADGKIRRIGMVGPIIRVDPFDPWGRRTFTMQTNDGPLPIIQGITEITPVWTKVEGLMGRAPYQWDMRIATSSVPRSTLSQVLLNQIDKKDVDQRRQIVKLYIESERYSDASAELAKMFEDFPALKKELGDLGRDLQQMSARRLLSEIKLRQESGQHELAAAMLLKFPDKGVAGIILGEVSEKLADYEKTIAKIKSVSEKLDAHAKLVEDAALRAQIEPVQAEIAAELNIHTLDRFADFLRLADADALKADQKAALAISNWIMGSKGGIQNLSVALSAYRVRNLARDYLRTTRRDERAAILEQLREEEAATPDSVAKIIAHMQPAVATEPQPETQVPGLFELTVPSFAGQADITYYVQLPPEYDPYKRYPAIVTLNGSATTPVNQIDWWAGVYNKELELRMGQAARRGYIVIAPAWTKKHQRKYEYSAQEHAAVLFPLRDASKRFSIDTDHVYLSGHSMGGDAAWDIGLAHPDLWAGVLPIVATTGKYVSRYWENAKHVPLYFVGGEMDGDRMAINGREFDRYLTKSGFDTVIVEYLGRGHEDFSDEIQRMFDWMALHTRDFAPEEFSVSTMRGWDNFFWWVELGNLPANGIVAPVLFDDKAKDLRPVTAEGTITPAANRVRLVTGAGKATVYLSPEIIDFEKRISISVNTVRETKDLIRPQVETILEDVRTRGDRMHPFWAKVEVSTGRR